MGIRKVSLCQQVWRAIQARYQANIRCLTIMWNKVEKRVLSSLRSEHERKLNKGGSNRKKLNRMAANSDFKVDSGFMEMLDEAFFPDEIPGEIQLEAIKNVLKRRYYEVCDGCES